MSASGSEDEDATAMAALMGFSTFGAAPAAKKRKFNHTTDAFVSGHDLAAIDKGGKKGQGSGGNQVPLGKTRSIGVVSVPQKEKLNGDEIDLDEDDEEDGGVGIRGFRHGGGDGDEEAGPSYIDTSLPPPIYDGLSVPPPQDSPAQTSSNPAEAAEMQARIDAILNALGPPPPSSTLLSATFPSDPPQIPSNLPQRPPAYPPAPGTVPLSFSRASVPGSQSWGGSQPRGRGRGRGERNERWFEDYYDPSFNENPWAGLEADRGIEAMPGTVFEGAGKMRARLLR